MARELGFSGRCPPAILKRVRHDHKPAPIVDMIAVVQERSGSMAIGLNVMNECKNNLPSRDKCLSRDKNDWQFYTHNNLFSTTSNLPQNMAQAAERAPPASESESDDDDDDAGDLANVGMLKHPQSQLLRQQLSQFLRS